MKSVSRGARRVAAIMVVGGWAVLGWVIAGCAPAPEEPVGAPAVEQAAPPAPEEPAESSPEKAAEPAAGATAEPAALEAPKPAEEAPKPAEETPKPAEEAPTSPAPQAADPAGGGLGAGIDVSKVSTFAPAKDLVSQVGEYLGELEESVESEEEFADSQSKLVKNANALILIVLALGLHDTDNQYKAAAPGLVKAIQALAAADDYASAKAGVEAVKAAAASQDGDPGSLAWEKAASLKALMEAVPLINSRLKRYLRGSRFESAADTTAGLTAVLAVIAQGSMANADETEKPDEVEQWHAHCAQMRDAAVLVHAAIRAQDEAAAKAAMKKLQQSCEDCHAIFHPEEE